jgi:acyl carrier protein
MSSFEALPGLVLSSFCEATRKDAALVNEQTNLLDAGLDSLGLTAIIARVETEYKRELSTKQIFDLFHAQSVKELTEGLALALEVAQ